jgi:hypothetical protein
MPSLLRSSLLLPLLAATLGAATPPIRVSEVDHQGQPSYKIETPSGTWIYHREGAGFASLLDPEGNDWIAYRPQGGAAGHFRGIPNAVFRRAQEGNNFFHPGHAGPKGSETTLVRAEPRRVLLRSQSRDGRWSCEWEILPDRAHLHMTRVPADDDGYWFLYEGTPGGRFDPTDLCIRPGGKVTPLSERWEAGMREAPWVAFASGASKYALLLVAHDPPDVPVSYRPMENAMTVFGFGRTLANLNNLLSGRQRFTVMLVAESDPSRIAAAAARISR